MQLKLYSGHEHTSRQKVSPANAAEILQWQRAFFRQEIANANAAETLHWPRAFSRPVIAHVKCR